MARHRIGALQQPMPETGAGTMAVRGLRAWLRAGSALGLLAGVTVSANAGGFAVHEQSAYFQGMSFAGAAAGGDLSGMFWNPAVMTQFAGVNSYTSISGILPFASNSPTAGPLLALGGTNNVGDQALVPGSYFSYQLNPSLWLGMSVNAPFGLSEHFPDAWAGRDYGAGTTFLRTYNASPSIAYRLNDWISVGVGVQIQYAKAGLNHFLTILGGNVNLSGDGWGYGFTAGVTLMPMSGTTIGLGYRSAINQKIDGSLATPIGAFGASTTVNLPDMVSLGIRQRINPQLTLLGTVEWTNWSRIGTSVISASPLPASPLLTLPFDYKDGWFFSAGAEYQATDRLTLRTGLAYEISPVTDSVRMPLVPDNDRFWASIGATLQITRSLSADLAYSHIWVRDPTINISAASGNPWFATTGVTYIGDVSAHVDILSIGIKYRWDEPKAPVKTGLITK
jgi:long-chain fatty acid transport protein